MPPGGLAGVSRNVPRNVAARVGMRPTLWLVKDLLDPSPARSFAGAW
jgi:hypothetical protein